MKIKVLVSFRVTLVLEILKAMLEKDPKKRPSPAELLTAKVFGGFENKESASETVDTITAMRMNQMHKSIQPKSLTALKALGSLSPKA